MMNRGHVEHYREFGYAVVKGVFGAGEVAELALAFDRMRAQGLRHPASFRHGNVLFRLGEDPRLGRILRMVQWPSYVDPVLARYRSVPRLLAILAPLLGRNLKQIINQMHWKPPGARAEFGYHQDIRFRRPREAYREPAASYVQTGIAIDPHRRENGAMTVIPGSHRLGELAFEGPARVMSRALSDDDLIGLGLDPASKVDLVLDPGDVALWHLYTIHGSGPNRSPDDERRFYLNGYVIAENCDRGEWAFHDGAPCALGAPVLVHYEDLHTRPEPHYVE